MGSEEIVEDVENLENSLESLLADSVRRQLVADVPVGVMLSGGVDSSVITALATRVRSDIKTFSVRFPGHNSLDETEHARRVARAFETDHVELSASEAEPDLLPRLAKQFDEPIVDSSMVPTYLVSQIVRSQCTVALGGDGGDELFGGYREYTRLDWLQRRLGFCPRLLRQVLASIAKYGLEPGVKGRNWLIAQGVDFDRELPLIANYFEPKYRCKLLPHVDLPISAESIFSSRVALGSQIVDRATRTDFGNYLPEDLLVKVDRSSMLKSLEVRSPFLDVRVINFAFSKVPVNLKAGVQGRKLLLKRVASRLLPEGFDLNRKQGFSIPINTWLTDGAWRGFFREVLLDPECMFHGKSVERIIRGLDRGRNNGERIFSLLMMELWRKEYGVHF
jgi:asparagine synthase (glutamine-hydrolysing)